MAKRRMFSQDIVESDAFLDMPATTQQLYFHLGMYADDDGFVNPKRIMRMIGVSDDDLKILLAKRFLLPFEGGVVVLKHWNMNNFIRKDRYTATSYGKEKETLVLNENGAYTELLTGVGRQMSTTGQPNDIPTVDPGKVRIELGKDNLATVSKDTAKAVYGKEEINELFDYWLELVGYAVTAKRQANRNACTNLHKRYGTDGVKKLIAGVVLANEDKYAPRISDFITLQAKLNDLMAWGNKNNKSKMIVEV